MNEFDNKIEKVSELMKSFSNKDKLSILCSLWVWEKNVTEIISSVKLSQSQTSQYLWKMKLEWLLISEKKWKEVYYKISDKKVLELISVLKNIF